MVLALVALSIIPTAIFLVLEMNVKVLIANNFRLYNAVDMLLNTLVYYTLLSIIKSKVLVSATSFRTMYCMGLLELAFHAGRIMHGTADVVHTLYTETQPRLSALKQTAPEVSSPSSCSPDAM